MPPTRRSPQALSRQNTAKKAFTLVEVMTATVIMIIIITFSLKIAVDTATIYDAGIASLKTASESRAVLAALTQDFESALVKNDNNVWIEINHPESIDNVPSANAPEIALFAPDPGRRKRLKETEDRIPGTICAIKYKIAHRSPFKKNSTENIQKTYSLYRASVDAQATFGTSSSSDTSPLATLLKGNRSPNEIWETGTADLIVDGRRETGQSLKKWLENAQNYKATGIVSLSLVFFYIDNKDQKLKALAHAEIATSVSEALKNTQISDVEVNTYNKNLRFKSGKIIVDEDEGNPQEATLKSVEFAVTVLSPDGDRALRAIQHQNSSPKINQDRFNTIVRKHGYAYNTTVAISQQ